MRWHYSLVLAFSVTGFMQLGHADESSPPAQTKHQMMKDCMAKQKASDGGISKEQMKQNCKDVTKPESENAKADKAAESGSPSK